LTYYFEGLAWYYEQHPDAAAEAIKRCKSLRTTSSFSMIFALLFYRVLLIPGQTDLSMISPAPPLYCPTQDHVKMLLFLGKGIAKLLE
jgi:hypothetical protein